jgi:hypothetical protein
MAAPDRPGPDVTAPPAELLADLADGFAAAGDRAGVLEYLFEVGGCPIRIRLTGDRFAHDLTAAFHHLPKPEHSAPADTINCWVDDREFGLPGSLLAPGETVDRAFHGKWVLRERYQFITGFEGCIDVFDPAGTTAWRRLGVPRLPWWEVAAPFRNPLFWLLGNRGRVLTHAAAVGFGGRAALIVGPGGSGKSTTALTCLLAGFDYLGDDYTVTSTDGGPRVDCLYGSAKLSPQGIEGMEDLVRDAAGFTGADGEKLVVWPSRTFPDRVVTSAAVQVILVPTITGEPATTLAPIAKAAALRALAPSSILQFPAGGAAALTAMARLVEAVPCRTLLLGTDRRSIPGVVADAIEGISGG